jgi:hypothetical protein
MPKLNKIVQKHLNLVKQPQQYNHCMWYEEMQDGTSITSGVKKCLLGTNCNVGNGYPEVSQGSLGTLNGFHWSPWHMKRQY